MYDCDATLLLNVYTYLVFVGKGYLAQLPSHLPHLRRLSLLGCIDVCDKYVEELVAAAPHLEVINIRGKIVRNKHLETAELL